MSVRTHMRSGSIQVPVRAELDLAAPQHRSTAERVPVLPAIFPKKHERERTPPSPTPPARRSGDRRANSLPRVNMPNSGGFGVGCLPYAQRDRTQPQTCDGPRRDWHPSARA